ncbi:hypothetical protein [Brevibacillus laterosporus]|uniref:Uncharacterized protein n=1 Tax=Brevibacillus laterosporus TaxID=1465 RepID=A0A0F6XYT9_BRELA|nr:hypothetical protein EX87_02115 [Brevibacillus laterosporus]
MKKVLFSVLASVFFTCSMTTVSYAKWEKMDETDYNEYLQDAGYPEEAIGTLELEQKEALYDEQAQFISFQEDESLIKDGEDNKNKRTKRDLEDENFTQSLLVSQINNDVKGTVQFRVSYNFNWRFTPFFTLTDMFGVSWSDDFDPLEDTAKYSYRQIGWYPYKGKRVDTQRKRVFMETYSKYTPGAGIGWKYDIQNRYYDEQGNRVNVSQHKGYGEVEIVKRHDKSGDVDSSSASAKYFHKEGGIDASFSFSGGSAPQVSISPKFNYSESNDVGKSWRWYHKDKVKR